jgi:hypothetical protein
VTVVVQNYLHIGQDNYAKSLSKVEK